MMTVVDQVSPWLTPSSTLAATTQPQLGAQISSSGTGSADQPPGDQDRLAAEPVRQRAGEEVGGRLGRAEREDERQRRGVGGQAELPLGQQRHHGALLAEHAADQSVDRHQQRELGQVGAQPSSVGAGAAVDRRPVPVVHAVTRSPASGRLPRPVRGPPGRTARSRCPGRSSTLAAVGGPLAVAAHDHHRPGLPPGGLAASEPSSTWSAPGRCPPAYSDSWRT